MACAKSRKGKRDRATEMKSAGMKRDRDNIIDVWPGCVNNNNNVILLTKFPEKKRFTSEWNKKEHKRNSNIKLLKDVVAVYSPFFSIHRCPILPSTSRFSFFPLQYGFFPFSKGKIISFFEKISITFIDIRTLLQSKWREDLGDISCTTYPPHSHSRESRTHA